MQMINLLKSSNNFDIASLVVGCLSLVGVVIGYVVAIHNINKQVIAKNISSPRIDWINQLKEITADYISKLQLIFETISNKEKVDELLNILFCLKLKLILHLNSISTVVDEYILKTLDLTYDSIKRYSASYKELELNKVQQLKSEIVKQCECLIFLISLYCKVEWEKVKSEVKNSKDKSNFDFKLYLLEHDNGRNTKLDPIISEFVNEYNEIETEIVKMVIVSIIDKKSKVNLKTISSKFGYSPTNLIKIIFPRIENNEVYKQIKGFTWTLFPLRGKYYKIYKITLEEKGEKLTKKQIKEKKKAIQQNKDGLNEVLQALNKPSKIS